MDYEKVISPFIKMNLALNKRIKEMYLKLYTYANYTQFTQILSIIKQCLTFGEVAENNVSVTILTHIWVTSRYKYYVSQKCVNALSETLFV